MNAHDGGQPRQAGVQPAPEGEPRQPRWNVWHHADVNIAWRPIPALNRAIEALAPAGDPQNNPANIQQIIHQLRYNEFGEGRAMPIQRGIVARLMYFLDRQDQGLANDPGAVAPVVELVRNRIANLPAPVPAPVHIPEEAVRPAPVIPNEDQRLWGLPHVLNVIGQGVANAAAHVVDAVVRCCFPHNPVEEQLAPPRLRRQVGYNPDRDERAPNNGGLAGGAPQQGAAVNEAIGAAVNLALGLPNNAGVANHGNRIAQQRAGQHGPRQL